MRASDKNPAFYDAFLAPMELIWFSRWRKKLLSGLGGYVLDIGSGTGINLNYYPDRIKCVTVLDPNETNLNYLQKKGESLGFGDRRCLKTMNGKGEELPFRSRSFDSVVSTLILCTVEDPEKVISEAVRVLRPGGKLILMEHQLPKLAPHALLFHAVTPLWKAPSGCHLNRRTEDLVTVRKDLKPVLEKHRGPLLGLPFFLGMYIKKGRL